MVVDGPQAWVGDRVVDTHSALSTNSWLSGQILSLITDQAGLSEEGLESKLSFTSDLFRSVFYCILKAGSKFEKDLLRELSSTSSLQEESVK